MLMMSEWTALSIYSCEHKTIPFQRNLTYFSPGFQMRGQKREDGKLFYENVFHNKHTKSFKFLLFLEFRYLIIFGANISEQLCILFSLGHHKISTSLSILTAHVPEHHTTNV
jgi:hypothetical protein